MKQLRLSSIIILLVILINLLVLINEILHDPGIGYDAQAHLDYVYVMPFRLPGPEDTNEFFSAPLPYFFPSITNLVAPKLFGISDTEDINGRTGQFLNFLLSLGTTILLVKICEKVMPGNDYYKISSLVLFGILPVIYKTFVQVRGEPYVLFFTFLSLYQIVNHLNNETRNWIKDGVFLGISLGLAILSRQWGFMLFPAIATIFIFIFVGDRVKGIRYVKMAALSFFVAFLVGGWFYIHLLNKFGTMTAFNREEQPFAFSNQPVSFYRNTGLRDWLLFKTPTRNTFNNLLIPTFYSDIWGDYWGFFVFIKSKVPFYGAYTNQATINPYLGRVNLVSLFPSLLFLAGLFGNAKAAIKSLSKRDQIEIKDIFSSLIVLIIFFSALGYLWFLVKYPEIPRGTTIKATYMLHALALLPFLAAEVIEQIRIKNAKAYSLILVGCTLVFLHNLPAMITRYWYFLKR